MPFSPFKLDARNAIPASAMPPDEEGYYEIKIVDGYDVSDGARRVLVAQVIAPAKFAGRVISDGIGVAIDEDDEDELTKFAPFWLAVLLSVGYTEDQAKKKVLSLAWKNFANKTAFVHFKPAPALTKAEKADGKKSYSNTKWLTEGQYKSSVELTSALIDDDTVSIVSEVDDEPAPKKAPAEKAPAKKAEKAPATEEKPKRARGKKQPEPEDDDDNDEVDPLDAVEDLL